MSICHTPSKVLTACFVYVVLEPLGRTADVAIRRRQRTHFLPRRCYAGYGCTVYVNLLSPQAQQVLTTSLAEAYEKDPKNPYAAQIAKEKESPH